MATQIGRHKPDRSDRRVQFTLIANPGRGKPRGIASIRATEHDDPKTQFGLALVGGDGCWQILSREPMLHSRLYHRVTFAPLASDSVLRWMGALTLLMVYEKTAKRGDHAVPLAGIALLAWAPVVLAHPAGLPALPSGGV